MSQNFECFNIACANCYTKIQSSVNVVPYYIQGVHKSYDYSEIMSVLRHFDTKSHLAIFNLQALTINAFIIYQFKTLINTSNKKSIFIYVKIRNRFLIAPLYVIDVYEVLKVRSA